MAASLGDKILGNQNIAEHTGQRYIDYRLITDLPGTSRQGIKHGPAGKSESRIACWYSMDPTKPGYRKAMTWKYAGLKRCSGDRLLSQISSQMLTDLTGIIFCPMDIGRFTSCQEGRTQHIEARPVRNSGFMANSTLAIQNREV